jgi:hypothetical protein
LLQNANIIVAGGLVSTPLFGSGQRHINCVIKSGLMRVVSFTEQWSKRLEFLKYFSAIGAVVFAVVIARKVFAAFSGPSREEQYRQLEKETRNADKQVTGENTPRCPFCSGDTEMFQYPHLLVWRCVRFPECRGFIKSGRSGTNFARKWREG